MSHQQSISIDENGIQQQHELFPHQRTATTNLICNLLQLNLKLFQDLFRYKHAFNSFQADINTHLTTIANQQQQKQLIDSESPPENGRNRYDDDREQRRGRKSKDNNLQQTKQKISDMICEKFIQICQDLGQPSSGQFGDDYESSIYSILAIVDDFNNNSTNNNNNGSREPSLFLVDDDDDSMLMDRNDGDSQLRCQSKQIGSFLSRLKRDQKFRQKLLGQLFEKLVDNDDDSDQEYHPNNNLQVLENIDNFDDDKDGECSIVVENISVSGTSNRNLLGQKLMTVPQYQCKFCLKVFEQVSLLIQHQREQHRSRFGCARCKQTFRNEYVLRIHLRKDSCSKLIFDPPVVACGSAKSQSPAIKVLQQQDSIIAPRNHLCQWPGCGKTFTRASYLSNHMMTHSNERNFACSWPGCPKRYKTQAHLLNHVLVHKKLEQKIEQESSETTTRLCPWNGCQMRFHQEYDLLEHYHQSHRGEPQKQHQVKVQQVKDQSQKLMKVSSSSSTTVKKIEDNDDASTPTTTTVNLYCCEYPECDFYATKLSQLHHHISVKHCKSVEQKFQCEYCGTSFRKKSSLSNHVKSHSGQFSCSWNGCTFRSHSAVVLSRHMMSHKDYITTNHSSGSTDGDQHSQDSQKQQNKETFTCKLCGKMFGKRASIINHVRSHSGQYSCQWPGCYFASQSKMLYRRHVLTANHDLDQLSPPSNQATTTSLTAIGQQQSILLVQMDEQSTSNENETTSFENLMDISMNSNEITTTSQAENDSHSTPNNDTKQIRIFHCRYPDCSYQTHKRPLYRVHMLKHSEVRKHRCTWPQCGKSFKAKSTLNRHLVRHRQLAYIQRKKFQHTDDGEIDEDPHENCQFEPMVIIDNRNNKEKISNCHDNDDESKNEVIPKTTDDLGESSSHSQSATTTPAHKFKCDHCPASFRTKSALSNHRISHRKPQFRCQHPGCFYETFRLTILQRHEQETHGKDQKIYRCSKMSCHQRSFLTWNDFHRHILMHKNETRFTCFWPGCKMGFNSRSTFQEHLESHQDEQKYRCTGWQDCDKTFNTKRGLLNHFIVHKNNDNKDEKRVFKCSWNGCRYSSSLSSNLRKHLNRHHRQSNLQDSDNEQEKDLETDTKSESTFISMPFVASISSSS